MIHLISEITEIKITINKRRWSRRFFIGISSQQGTLAPWAYGYDERGRLTSAVRGDRSYGIEYGADGFISAMIDPLGQRTELVYDDAGRLTELTHPDGAVMLLDHDATRNLTGVTPPERPQHRFIYQPGGLLQSYQPPALATPGDIAFSYDAYDALERVDFDASGEIRFRYDTHGRLAAIELAEETIAFDYDPTTGQLASAVTPEVALDYYYDGALPDRIYWTGTVSGNVSWSFDDNLRMIRERVNNTSADYLYDNDGLMVQAGEQALVRDPDNGFIESTTLGDISSAYLYNVFGEVESHTATSALSGQLYQRSDSYDRLGRVIARTETVLGETHEYDYAYDERGRLYQVLRDDTPVESYTYDNNGNRIAATTEAAGTVTASHDAQDRLIGYGAISYSHSSAGDIIRKQDGAEITDYYYDRLGNLRQVDLPDTTAIEYLIDARGRRVGKKVDGELQQGFLYRDALSPVAELGSDGSTVVSRFVYASRAHVPDYMVKEDVSYRFITDPVGSVRLVVNTTDGSVAQRIDYDAFGNVLLDTNPGFQPFGFAGGLYDADTGLVRFGAREYDAEIGRWTAKDPIFFYGNQLNLYSYVGADPINRIDVYGLVDIFIGVEGEAILPAGVAGSAGVNLDTDSLSESGFYTSGGGGVGLNVGAGVCIGVVSEIEGDSKVIDINLLFIGVEIILDSEGGFSGFSVGIGPGGGISYGVQTGK